MAASNKEIAKRAKRPPRTPSVRLRRSDTGGPGILRRRAGRGFTYVDADGHRVDDSEVLSRIHDLVIPPAWREVWICPYPGGHIQATGIDQKGRKQYLYHPKWRERRDQEKFDEMLRFARALPGLRERVEADLAGDDDDLGRERILATAVRLLDRGFFRIGSEDYAVENESYGLATMRKEHVTLGDGFIVFDYPAKSGRQRVQRVVDPGVAAVVERLKRRRGGGEELLAYKRGGRWVDVKSPDINAYVKQATGGDFSAKDFRTWGATVLAAMALSVSAPAASGSKTARNRAKTRAIKEVAGLLGNTPAVCRASYIDPRVFDRFDGGLTIGGILPEFAEDTGAWPDMQGRVEEAVLDLLQGQTGSPALEKVA